MRLSVEEIRLINDLRTLNPSQSIPSYDGERTRGQRMADHITRVVGSWRFLIIQSCLLLLWLMLNVTAYVQHWDPYPFILLNLALSFQAAYTAPVIMMSQNREGQIDRAKLEYYYHVNLKQELEIELLHQKMDDLLRHFKLEGAPMVDVEEVKTTP
jgi:uncharacterized membrane protein